MDFSGINYLGILVAAVAAFAFGAVYYSALGKPWMKAARIKPDEAKMEPALFAVSFVAELVMAFILAGLIAHISGADATPWSGIVTGFFVWIGFMGPTVAVNQRYQGFGWDLTIIDAGHWLGVALVMGGILGWFSG